MRGPRSIITRRVRVWAALLVGAASSACGDPTGVRQDFIVARARWRAMAPPAYEVTVGVSCFCVPSNGVTILVRDGHVVSARDALTGAALPQAEAERYPTVDKLFADIAAASERSGSSVTAEYDAMYGFPRHAWIDYSAQWVDDEVDYYLTDFHPR